MLVVKRCRGQHGQCVSQRITAILDAAEHLGRDRDESTVGLGGQPVQVIGWDPAQPPAHGRFRPADPGGDTPETQTVHLVYQRVSDHLGGVGVAPSRCWSRARARYGCDRVPIWPGPRRTPGTPSCPKSDACGRLRRTRPRSQQRTPLMVVQCYLAPRCNARGQLVLGGTPLAVAVTVDADDRAHRHRDEHRASPRPRHLGVRLPLRGDGADEPNQSENSSATPMTNTPGFIAIQRDAQQSQIARALTNWR